MSWDTRSKEQAHTRVCPKLHGEPESLSLTALRRPREGAIGHSCWVLDSAGESPEEWRGVPAPEVHDPLGKATCQTQLSLLATGPAPDVCRGRSGPKGGALRPPGPASGGAGSASLKAEMRGGMLPEAKVTKHCQQPAEAEEGPGTTFFLPFPHNFCSRKRPSDLCGR